MSPARYVHSDLYGERVTVPAESNVGVTDDGTRLYFGYEAHPACDLFPLMDGEPLKELAADVAVHGLLEPIVLHEGQILDGRNRAIACDIAGAEPHYREWEGNGSPTEWVISANLKRRHLTNEDRALIAVDLRKLFEGEARKRKLACLKRGNQPASICPELDEQGRAMLRRSEKRCLHLGRWLPTLGNKCRPRFPGDLVTVLADTGVGKTAVLQNLAWCARMPTLFFGMELSGAQMGERMLALSTNQGAPVVQRLQKEGAAFDYKSTEHIVLCPESGLTIDDMTHYIERADLKLGERPALVLIDYIGLVRGGTGSRYERLSQAAESIKVMAKETDTVVVVASQVHRPSDKDKVVDPGLHDAKDSGSIENSSQLVLGLSRPNNGDMTVRVLKDTTGGGVGTYVECNFHGATFRITERAWTPGAGE